jgi:hypothetical protein
MNWPALPVSGTAIALCLQMMALWFSWRYLDASTRIRRVAGPRRDSLLAVLAGTLLVGFNAIMVTYSFFEWVRL